MRGKRVHRGSACGAVISPVVSKISEEKGGKVYFPAATAEIGLRDARRPGGELEHGVRFK